MKPLDRVRQGTFTLIFGWFAIYTANNVDFNPYPKWLNEKHQKQWEAVGLDESQLQEGDLVLRHARGFVSDAILSFSTNDPQYSHSGIVRKIKGKTYVYHASGGEENMSNSMKCDELALYCHPAAIFKFGVFHFDLPDHQRAKFISILDEWYKQGVEFDFDFDMYTDDKMYCSEMIYKALTLATNDKNYIPLSRVIDKPYVAIDNLYLNDHCNLIFDFNYD
jgi:Permuted papain-like amidase enzyme, YaeF/YiiX, C92 family